MNFFNEAATSSKVGQVLKTNDLFMFKTIQGNRPPNPQHIKRLANSMSTYGVLQNPIIVNENYEIIDGQHRLMAAKKAEKPIYYIVVEGYNLDQVHALNLNQKNWTQKDFMLGYAEMGYESYIKLKEFTEKNKDYNLSDCIALCSNLRSHGSSFTDKVRANGNVNLKEVFDEGTWKGKDFNLAQEWADKIRLIKTYYDGYRRSTFVGTMIGMFKNDSFDFNEFMRKLRLQPTALVDCPNRPSYKALIEDIYNYKRRDKVNLRF